MIELAPDLDDDLGKNMREMLALRCLEALCGLSNEVSNGHSKVGFDFSESCEDVLQHIMHEVIFFFFLISTLSLYVILLVYLIICF